MIKIILSFIIAAIGFMIPSALWAQSPQEFNYQAVLRDNGNLITEESVDVRFSLRQGSYNGTVVYKEFQSTTTDQFGHLNLAVGAGTALTGVFANIDWANGAKYLQVEVNYGSGYEDMGAQQLLSVPYALHAGNSSSGSNPTGAAGGDLTGTYPNPEIANAAVTGDKIDQMGAVDGQILKWNGTIWEAADDETGSGGGAGDDWGAQVAETNTTLEGDGTTADPLGLADNAVTTSKVANAAVTGDKIDQMGAVDGQILKWNGTIWEAADDETGSGGGVGDDWGAQVAETNTTLEGDGTTADPLGLADNAVTTSKVADDAITTDKLTDAAVTSDKINQMGAVDGQILKWNGTIWEAADDETGSGGGAGDDWGAQTVETDVSLNGDGTTADPLGLADNAVTTSKVADAAITTGKLTNDAVTTAKLADATVTSDKLNQMGATTDQVLKFDGTNWVPSDEAVASGDDWGAQTVETDVSLSGDGTTGNELSLAKQGATDGQILTWDDSNSTWIPTDPTIGGADGFFEADADKITYSDDGNFGKTLLVNTDQIDIIPGESENKMMFLPSKGGAFRAGSVNGDDWNLSNIGNSSVTFGAKTKASGDYSTAMGFLSEAIGVSSTALGDKTKATGSSSTAMGIATAASGDYSTAMGRLTEASGNYTTSIGWQTRAIDTAATAMGHKTLASGKYSTAMGTNTIAWGEASTAMGTNTTASGEASIAMGFDANASGDRSTVMGSYTTASGNTSTAMGRYSEASGNTSTAMGVSSEASGSTSTAMGVSTEASGSSSTAMGRETEASGNTSTAMGYRSLAKGEHSIAIGDSAKASVPNAIAIGKDVWAQADNSIVIGTNAHLHWAAQGSIYLADKSRTPTTKDMRQTPNRFYARYDNGYTFFTDGTGNIGARMHSGANSWSTISDRNKKENIKIADGKHFIESIKKMELGSWNYIGQDATKFRHYGPMAQDFYKYFGNDGVGTIGNDTTIASADIDGVMMIAIKALADENDTLKKEVAQLKQQMNTKEQAFEAKIEAYNNTTGEMEKRLSRMEALIERTEPDKVYSKL